MAMPPRVRGSWSSDFEPAGTSHKLPEMRRTMSDTATLDAARENADAVSRLIEQYLGQNGQAKNAQDIVKFARLLWYIVRDIWDQFQVRLDHGLEAGHARQAAASAALA